MRSGSLVEMPLLLVESLVSGDGMLTGLLGFVASPGRSAGPRVAVVRVARFRNGECRGLSERR